MKTDRPSAIEQIHAVRIVLSAIGLGIFLGGAIALVYLVGALFESAKLGG